MMALTLDMQTADLALTEADFYRLCKANPKLRLELSASGELVVMPPTGWDTGYRNASLNRLIGNWATTDGTGIVFDSSTGFTLPSGAIRSPDVSWILRSRIEAINPDPYKFLPLCPDFAVELRSASDSLSPIQEKLQEYLDNGLRLGWLIDSKRRIIEIYRPEQPVKTVDFSTEISGKPVLKEFTLDIEQIYP